MNIRFLAEAEAEVQKVAAWYEGQREGLGDEFLAALQQGLEAISRTPQAFSLATPVQPDREVRRFVMNRFPYTIFYEVRPDEALILAVTHQKQRPGAWRQRRNGA
jgi:toxin ParE1/3/4